MIPHFKKGKNKLADLNRVVDAANAVHSANGDGIIEVVHTEGGMTANINIDELAHRLPSRNIPRFVAKIIGSGTPSWNISGSGSGSGENIDEAYSFAEQTLGPISGSGGEWINKTNGRGDSSTYNLFEISNETLEEGDIVYAWKQDITAAGKVVYSCIKTGSGGSTTGELLQIVKDIRVENTGVGLLDDTHDWRGRVVRILPLIIYDYSLVDAGYGSYTRHQQEWDPMDSVEWTYGGTGADWNSVDPGDSDRYLIGPWINGDITAHAEICEDTGKLNWRINTFGTNDATIRAWIFASPVKPDGSGYDLTIN